MYAVYNQIIQQYRTAHNCCEIAAIRISKLTIQRAAHNAIRLLVVVKLNASVRPEAADGGTSPLQTLSHGLAL
jgi:hypothetical protein